MIRSERHVDAMLAALLVGALSLGCGGQDAEDAEFENVRRGLEDAAQGLGDAAAAMRDAMEEATAGAVDEPLNFREFYDLLPERLGEFARTSREGSTQGAMGMDVSQAEATYENEEGASFRVEITDVGAIGGPALMGLAAWANVTIDRETDRGWERTTEYRGHPSWEKFSRSNEDRGRAEFNWLVERRFMVQVTGRRVTWDEVEAFLDDFDAGELEEMADREG